MWLASSTTGTSLLLLRRFNNSVSSSKSCRRRCDALLLLLIHQTSSFFTTTTTTTTTTFNSSSSSYKFSGGSGGTFILHRQANNLHTTTTTSFPSSSSSSKFGTIILQTNEPSVEFNEYGRKKKDIIKMFMLSSSSSGSGEEEEEEDDDDQKKEMVFKLDEDIGGFSEIYKDFNLQDSIRMVGSCNGIICLHDPEMKWQMRDVYLWNPATKQFKILPDMIRESYSVRYKHFIGFGFDVETQDYKVLRITPFRTFYSVEPGVGCRVEVQVYSLSTDSWKILDGINVLPLSPSEDLFQNRQGTYMNGSCFFLGSTPINHNGIIDLMLLSFDFTKEIFTIIELPKCCCHKLVLNSLSTDEDEDVLVTSSSQLHDDDIRTPYKSPVFFRTPRIDFAGGYVFTTPQIDLLEGGGGYWYYKMWRQQHHIDRGSSSSRLVMDKATSWNPVHEFRMKARSKHPPYSEPRCVSNDGEFALISTNLIDDNGRKKLMLFNLVTHKATKDFTIDCRVAYVYKESQVSIMDTGGNALLRWQLPTHGTTYKLNLDAPFIDDDICTNFGIGLCLTSDTGGCIGVRSLNTFVSDPEEGEALAMFEAIKWAKELELSPFIIESDSKDMVSFFMKDVDDSFFMEDEDVDDYCSSIAPSILREAKLLLISCENSISFLYCSTSCNYVANIASKLGSHERTWSCKDWTAKFPGEVVISLSKDLGLET